MAEQSLKSKTVGGVLWSSVNKFSVSGIGFVISIILARLLTPADYGIIAMFAIFTAVSNSFINSGFGTALIRKLDRTEADICTMFYFNVVVSVLCYLILFLIAPVVADFYDMPQLTSVMRVSCLGLIISAFSLIQTVLLNIKLDFKTPTKVSIFSVSVSGVVGIVVAYAGFGVWALVVQSLLSSLLTLLGLIYYVRWKPTTFFSVKSFKELFGFGSKLLASSMLDEIYRNLTTLIIGKVYAASTLGIYNRAQTLAAFPAQSVTGVLQSVTYPVLSTIQEDKVRLAENYRRVLRMSAYIVFPLMTGLVAIADPLIRGLLTDKWAESIPYLQLICFSMMWWPIHAINLNILQVCGRSDLFLRLEIIKKVIGVAILAITIPQGILALCIGGIISSQISVFINTYYTGKLINVSYARQMKDLIPIFFNSCIMASASYASTLMFDNYWLSVALGCMTAVSYYFISSFLTKNAELKELVQIIQRRN